jgi:hypothetical protein
MPAAAARGAIARINRGAPDASLDMIVMPSVVAVCSFGVTGRSGPGSPGGVGVGVGDEPAHAAANSSDGTASVLIRIMLDLPLVRDYISDGQPAANHSSVKGVLVVWRSRTDTKCILRISSRRDQCDIGGPFLAILED